MQERCKLVIALVFIVVVVHIAQSVSYWSAEYCPPEGCLHRCSHIKQPDMGTWCTNCNVQHFLAIVAEYMDTCTPHGVPHLNTRSRFKQIIWSIFLAVALLCFSVHIFLLVSRYLEHDVITQWYTPSASVPQFPVVVLCHAAPFSGIRTTEMTFSDDIPFKQVALHNTQDFWKIALSQDLDHIGTYQRKWNGLARLSLQPYTFNWNVTHEPYDAVVECFYNNEKCTSANFTRIWFPYYNHCFAFRPVHRSVFHNYKTSGLSLVLYTQDRRGYLTDQERLHWFHGYYLSLVDEGHLPHPDRMYTEVATGYATTVSFKQTLRKKIKSGKDKCVETTKAIYLTHHDENGNYATPVEFKYDTDACKLVTGQRIFAKECNCFSDHHLIPVDDLQLLRSSNITWCRHIPTKSLVVNRGYSLLNDTVVVGAHNEIRLSKHDPIFQKLRTNHECWKRVRARMHSIRPESNCHEPCESKEYYTTSHGFAWPSRLSYEKSLQAGVIQAVQDARSRNLSTVLETLLDGKLSSWNESLRKVQSNFLLLNIHSEDTHVLMAEESLVYPVRNLLSDFGGTLGLWIGCSIISIIEIGWFMGMLLMRWYSIYSRSATPNNNVKATTKPLNPNYEL